MRKGVIVVGLILAILVCSLFIGCEDKIEVPDGLSISIMSFNIRQDTAFDAKERDWDYRKEYLIQHIKDVNPDVLCMQEVQKNQYQDIDAGLEDYGVVWYSRKVDESEEGLAVAYNMNSYELVSQDMFWFSETPNVESKGFGATWLRICVHAILKHKETQKELSVYSVHLEVTSEKARKGEAQMLVDKLKADDRNAIVCGDFNTTYESESYSIVTEELNSVQATAPITDDGITYQSFGDESLVSEVDPIDFIFVDKNIFSYKFDILQEHKEIDGKAVYYSDHYAVLGVVVIPD